MFENSVSTTVSFWLAYVEKTVEKAAITCSKLTKETLEQGLKYVQS